MTTDPYSVQTLRAYLLGQLPEPETERLDEASITDEACAERISAVEHDLLDAFARGELHGVDLEHFRSRYLTTPARREAARFADALQSLGEEPFRRRSSAVAASAAAAGRERWRSRERLAAAAAVLALAAGSLWLVLDNRMLRGRVTSVESSRDELLRERQRRDAATQQANTAQPADGRRGSPPSVVTLVLVPQLRSARQLPAVALTAGTSELPVQLDLEPVDHPSYDVSLFASSPDRRVWGADGLVAARAGGRQTLHLRVPASVLSPQEYLIRVSGVPARGPSEIVGEYGFAVVR